MHAPVTRTTATMALLSICLACGDSTVQSEHAKQSVCQVGTRYTCFRRNCTGHQECMSDGARFTPCVCDDLQPLGNAGSGGAGGAGAAQVEDAGQVKDAGRDDPVPPDTG
jgi:hypothetical protein